MPSSPMSQARGMRYRAPTILQIRPTTLKMVMPLRMDFCVLLKKRPPKKAYWRRNMAKPRQAYYKRIAAVSQGNDVR